MPVRWGTLLLGASPVGTGISGALRGFADLAGTEEAVIAKQLPIPEILGEVFCALLCRGLGLPAPEPLILKDQREGHWMFGAVDLPYPNCSQFLNLDVSNPKACEEASRVWAEFLTKWTALPKVIAFDEWVNNRDRHPGNLLWCDENEFSLIDHGKALNLDPIYPDHNKLVVFWLLAANGDELAHRRMMNATKVFTQNFNSVLPQEVTEDMNNLNQEELINNFTKFINIRLLCILDFIAARFPSPSQKEMSV